MADMRKCIGSAKFGIEAHEAPVTDFPAQPSQKDGLGPDVQDPLEPVHERAAEGGAARKAAEASTSARHERADGRRARRSSRRGAEPSVAARSTESRHRGLPIDAAGSCDVAAAGRLATRSTPPALERHGAARRDRARSRSRATRADMPGSATVSAPRAPGATPGALLRAVASVATPPLIAARGPTWAPTGQPGRVPDRRPLTFLAKLGRVHTVARRGLRASRVAPMGYPAPVGRRTLRRVARAAQHRGVGDVERRTASGERHDVIDGQVARRVGGALVARAPVAVLATPGAEHAGAETLPGTRAVQGVVAAAVGLPGVRRCSDCPRGW